MKQHRYTPLITKLAFFVNLALVIYDLATGKFGLAALSFCGVILIGLVVVPNFFNNRAFKQQEVQRKTEEARLVQLAQERQAAAERQARIQRALAAEAEAKRDRFEDQFENDGTRREHLQDIFNSRR